MIIYNNPKQQLLKENLNGFNRFTKVIIVCILLALTTVSKANYTKSQSDTDNQNTDSYSLICYSDSFNNLSIIKFNIPSDNYVKIIVSDKNNIEVETLVEGDLEKGLHTVYFKAKKYEDIKNLNCTIKVYREEAGKIVFTKEIKLEN